MILNNMTYLYPYCINELFILKRFYYIICSYFDNELIDILNTKIANFCF